MLSFTKGLKKFSQNLLDPSKEKKRDQKNPNNEDERKFSALIQNDISTAESVKDSNDYSASTTTLASVVDDNGIEQIWDDEYKIKKGGGLQWSTSFAYRDKRARKKRPNSEDNFVFNTIQTMNANMTVDTPEITIEGQGDNDDDIANKLTDLCRANDERNNFSMEWKDIVDEFNSYGPAIMKIEWDNDIYSGCGDKRFIGDVRRSMVNKREFFPDPAIVNLEKDLQKGRYHIERHRQMVEYIKKRWKEKAYSVSDESNDEEYTNEGGDPRMAYVYEYWHKSFPFYVPKERAKELRDRAMAMEESGDYYKAQDLYDAANGDLEGVHVAYICQGVLLEYIPYQYDHGLYPYEFATKYRDEFSPWGWGEIRNIKIPQIMHNKADEIEMEAMTRQGLGGKYYDDGAVTPKQYNQIQQKDGKGGEWLKVNNIDRIKDRQPVQVPASITNYKEHKQRMIQDVSSVNAIQQGISPGANVPYRTVAELGSRADVRIKQGVEKLEDLLTRAEKQRLLLFAQFYTETRYYRVIGADGKIKDGEFNAEEMYQEWTRTDTEVDPETGQEVEVQRQERFIPEFDVKVTILNEKPNDRSYYTSVAFDMHGLGYMTGEDLWKTIDEGKLPPVDDVIQNYKSQDMVKQMMADVQAIPPEIQQQVMQQMAQTIQAVVAQLQGQGQDQGMIEGQMQGMEGMEEEQLPSIEEAVSQQAEEAPLNLQDEGYIDEGQQIPMY